jgi:hypothetical protein
MTREEVQKFATEAKLGNIHFQFNPVQNGSGMIEVGYIFRDGRMVLFCKRGSKSAPDTFYLCNEFRKLNGTE